MTEQLLMLARNEELWSIENSQLNLGEFLKRTLKSFQSAYHRKIEFVEENSYITIQKSPEASKDELTEEEIKKIVLANVNGSIL